jgi:hypothetical protein
MELKMKKTIGVLFVCGNSFFPLSQTTKFSERRGSFGYKEKEASGDSLRQFC